MSSADEIDDKKWRHLDETVVESFFDRARQNLHCRIACGGLSCKHEDFTKQQFHPLNKKLDPKDKMQPPQKAAIHGLNSNWVGDLIVAAQRPSTCLFAKYNHIDQFNEQKITGVFNLQEKGEHAFCGPNGIFSDSGYSYNGERDLMRYGISYYEFPWPDMTAPENDIVFRSVQCMDSHIKKLGRVLVHCHAGLGRTGLMIACYFIMCQHVSAKNAIELVRRCRNGAIQTSRQVAFVEGFEKFSRALGFTMKRSPKDPFLDFASYMKRQYEFLHGDESRTYRFVPYHIHQILCRVIDLASTGGRNAANEALMAFSLSNQPSAAVVDSCRSDINQRRYDPEKTSNISLLIFLVLDWFRAMDSPFFAREHANIFLIGMRNPKNFIQNISEMQAARRKEKLERRRQKKLQQQQQQNQNQNHNFSPKNDEHDESRSLNNTNYHSYLAQQQQQQQKSPQSQPHSGIRGGGGNVNQLGSYAGGAIPTWQLLSPNQNAVQLPPAVPAPPPIVNQTLPNNQIDDDDSASSTSASPNTTTKPPPPSSSDDDETGKTEQQPSKKPNLTIDTTLTSNNNNNIPFQPQQIAVVPPASPFYSGGNTNIQQQQNFNASTASSTLPSAVTAKAPATTEKKNENSTGSNNNNNTDESLSNTLNNTVFSLNNTTGSLLASPSTAAAAFTATFHKKPRIPWILQKEVEDHLPREVRHTAALVLSAIATLVAEAAPIPSLLDMAIQSTVDAFTLNLPPNTYHTFYYRSAEDDDNKNGGKKKNNDDEDDSESSKKRKMYRLAPDDRRLLYEAFTRWCAHEHSTYFDVFSNNSLNSENSPLLFAGSTTFNGGASSRVGSISPSRKDLEQKRIMSGLTNAAESRMPNFSSKMQKSVRHGNNSSLPVSRSTTPTTMIPVASSAAACMNNGEPAVENIE